MAFFAKKEKTPQIKEHFHKCPLCGEEIKTTENKIFTYNKKYLDGQRKISIHDRMSFYHLCPRCGFVYIYKNYDNILPVSDSIRVCIKSDDYQSILNNETIDETLKKIKLLKQLSYAKTLIGIEANLLMLNYYEEKQNEERIQEYLLKRIDEVPFGLCFAEDLNKGEICIEIDSSIKMHNNEVLTDLYRRSGQFSKAKETAEFALNTYDFPSNNHSIKKYYEFQIKLIEAQDKRHI